MQITRAYHHPVFHTTTHRRATGKTADRYEPASTPPTGLTRKPFQPQQTPELLERMRPYLREVHVVSPAAQGAPPVLGGEGIAPSQLPTLPSRRWVVTPEIEAAHRQQMEVTDNSTLRRQDQELKTFVVPILARRYGSEQNQVAVELGPADNTDLAGVLGQGNNLYFGMDLSKPLLEKNRELVNEPGYYIPEAYQVHGDTYQMPFRAGVADVVAVSCHPPFVSATADDQLTALSEVHRVLKPGGEFVLFPWREDRHDPRVNEFLSRNFELVESHSSHQGSERKLLILKARGPDGS